MAEERPEPTEASPTEDLQKGIDPLDEGESMVPEDDRRGISRRKLLLGGIYTVAAAAAGAGGARKFEGEEVKNLQAQLTKANGIIKGIEEALGFKDGELGECLGDAAITSGEKNVLQMKLADAVAGSQEALAEKNTEIAGLQEGLHVKTQQAAEQKSFAEELGRKLAEARQKTLLTEAEKDVFEGLIKREPGKLLEALQEAITAIPMGKVDDAQRALSGMEKTFTAFMETVRKWIVPLKEIAENVGKIVLPLAKTGDRIITASKAFGMQAGALAFVSGLETIFNFAEGKLSPSGVKDLVRKGRVWLGGVKPELEFWKDRETKPFEFLVAALLDKIEQIDKDISAAITDPPIQAGVSLVGGALKGARDDIGKWAEDTMQPIAEDDAAKKLEFAEAQAIAAVIRDEGDKIFAVLGERGLEWTVENVRKIAAELAKQPPAPAKGVPEK